MSTNEGLIENDGACDDGLWVRPGAPPPPPPPTRVVVEDPSCHGVLGVALREALAGLLVPVTTAATTTIPAEVDALPAASAAAASCENGEVVAEDEARTAEGEEETSVASRSRVSTASPKLKPEMLDPITKSLGEAIARSQQQQHDHPSPEEAVAAVLRGRVDHYNRRGAKWRIVVDGAEIRRRLPLEGRRRGRERPSLWEVSEGKKKQAKKAGTVKSTKLEILAYNDVE